MQEVQFVAVFEQVAQGDVQLSHFKLLELANVPLGQLEAITHEPLL